jgi:hypothetical protein
MIAPASKRRNAAKLDTGTGCPACRASVHDRRHILTYKRSYLCATDRATWDAANAQDRLKGRVPRPGGAR